MLRRVKGIWSKFSIELSAKEYGSAFDLMAEQHSPDMVDRAITKLRDSQPGDDVPPINAFWEACREVSNSLTKGQLWDKNCGNCDEGWEEVGWSWFSAQMRNKAIRLYGFEEAQRKTCRIRCRVCWKGPR